ncbi:MAG: hypothetical protein AB2722_17960 [Candidatus Thiodiazotropha sp.]
MNEINDFIKLLSNIQFKAELGLASYIIIIVMTGVGSYLGSYLKKKGERVATKEDFDGVLSELQTNTEAIENIKTKFSEQNWINQQVWLKKQEAYSSIFALLLNVQKYVSHQVNEFSEWEDIHHYHPYCTFMYSSEDEERLKKEWEQDKKTYQKKISSPEYAKEAQLLKLSYEKSISKLFDLIDLHSIYLSNKVEKEIDELKKQLSTTLEEEEWDLHFERIAKATSSTIKSIREISRKELKI